MSATPFAVLWDVDGTLLDSAEQHFQAWQNWAEAAGRPFDRAGFAHTFGWRNPEIVRHLYDPEATDAECAAIGLRKETLYREMVARHGAVLLPGVSRLLAEFEHAGWRQAVGSSAPRANLDLLLAKTDILRYFSAIVSGDDVTRGKPNPEVFLTSAARVGVEPSRCVVFEDAVAGIAAASAAGMVSVGVTAAGHHPASALSAAGATIVVESLAEMTLVRVMQLFAGA